MLKQGDTQDRGGQERLRNKAQSHEGKLIWAVLFCFRREHIPTEFPIWGESAGASTPSESQDLPLPGQYGFLFHMGLKYCLKKWLTLSRLSNTKGSG